jgi:hypothetical protein
MAADDLEKRLFAHIWQARLPAEELPRRFVHEEGH